MVLLRGTFEAEALLVQLTFIRDVACPEHLSGSFGDTDATVTTHAVFKLLKDNAEVGTVTVAPGTAAPTSWSPGFRIAFGD